MRKLLIAGAGGCGRDVYQWALHRQAIQNQWDWIGFLDDNVNALNAYGLSHQMQGTIEGYIPSEQEQVVCAIGDSRVRLDICKELKRRGAKFSNVIHPSVIIAQSCKMSEGIMACPGAVLCSNTTVENFVLINTLSVAGHDVVLEMGCTLSPNSNIMGFAHLEEGVFIGGSAKVLPGIRIGRYAKVGAGAVVVKPVDENTIVVGNPARRYSAV